MRDFTSWFNPLWSSNGALSTTIHKISCEIPAYWAGNRFRSGAYTTVREHFEAVRNAAVEQKMIIYK
jgi:hypothetical protein